ncbi:MAG: indole-3-glycerol phosphate synthase TrpC [Candidatus Nanopelagicaceae bacterium]|nr:indole-3-glycerol phosphate synthase TrpC [Candidatus Nanopelagicaceae bacterium]
MLNVLDQIIEGVREDLAERKKLVELNKLIAKLSEVNPVIDVLPSLQSSKLSVIAEVKRSSPSKGALAQISDPAALALSYQTGGATAVSVLTESRKFGGSLADLSAVRSAVNIPILRKDFTIDEYQIFEARAYGADIILLIVAALSDLQLSEFFAISKSLGMQVLVETHTLEEVERALLLDPEIIGVNARDLTTLKINQSAFNELATAIPAGTVKVAESGIASIADVISYRNSGAEAILVGEALVKDGDPAQMIQNFINRADTPDISKV